METNTRLEIRVSSLDDEFMVATIKPAGVQCIRWAPDLTGNLTTTELLRCLASEERLVN